MSHAQRRRDEFAQSFPFTPHSALPVSSTSFYSPLPSNQALRKDSARSYLFTPPFFLLFCLDICLLCSPFKSTACHTASTFYATQEKEQEAGQIRVVVVVASQVAIDTQDHFFFCKSSGLESPGISPPIHFIFSGLRSFIDAVSYRYLRCFFKNARADCSRCVRRSCEPCSGQSGMYHSLFLYCTHIHSFIFSFLLPRLFLFFLYLSALSRGSAV